jgi:hypothetical protein
MRRAKADLDKMQAVHRKAQPSAVLQVEPNPAPVTTPTPESEKPGPTIRTQSEPVPQPTPEPSVGKSTECRPIGELAGKKAARRRCARVYRRRSAALHSFNAISVPIPVPGAAKPPGWFPRGGGTDADRGNTMTRYQLDASRCRRAGLAEGHRQGLFIKVFGGKPNQPFCRSNPILAHATPTRLK